MSREKDKKKKTECYHFAPSQRRHKQGQHACQSYQLHPQNFQEETICEGCFAHQSICLVTGVFEGGCWPSTHSSQGFPFHFSLFTASSLNLWGWRQVWSNCKSSTSLLQSEENMGQNQPVNPPCQQSRKIGGNSKNITLLCMLYSYTR